MPPTPHHELLLLSTPTANQVQAVRQVCRRFGPTVRVAELENVLAGRINPPVILATSSDLARIRALADAFKAAGADVATLEMEVSFADRLRQRFGRNADAAASNSSTNSSALSSEGIDLRRPKAILLGVIGAVAVVAILFTVVGLLPQSEPPDRPADAPAASAATATDVGPAPPSAPPPAAPVATNDALAETTATPAGSTAPAGSPPAARSGSIGRSLKDTVGGRPFVVGVGLTAGLVIGGLGGALVPRGNVETKPARWRRWVAPVMVGAALLAGGLWAAGVGQRGDVSRHMAWTQILTTPATAAKAAPTTAPPAGGGSADGKGPFERLVAKHGADDRPAACPPGVKPFADLACRLKEMHAPPRGSPKPGGADGLPDSMAGSTAPGASTDPAEPHKTPAVAANPAAAANPAVAANPAAVSTGKAEAGNGPNASDEAKAAPPAPATPGSGAGEPPGAGGAPAHPATPATTTVAAGPGGGSSASATAALSGPESSAGAAPTPPARESTLKIEHAAREVESIVRRGDILGGLGAGTLAGFMFGRFWPRRKS